MSPVDSENMSEVEHAYWEGRADERKALMEGLPDAFIAHHPEHGFCYDAFSSIANHECFEGMANGWQVVPVKLLRMEADKK